MISVVFGVSAAVCWGAQNVLMARAARQIDPSTVAAQYVGYQALLAIPIAAVAVAIEAPPASEVARVLAGGAAAGLGVMWFANALSRGAVGLLTGLLSLAGATAAVLSVAIGESLDWTVALGLVLASTGGVALVSAPGERAPATAIRFTVLAIAGNGVGLWLLGTSSLGLGPSLVAYNAASLLSIAIYQAIRGTPIHLSERDDRHWLLVLASVLGLAGLACFTIGAQEGSPAVASVFATQFASVAAIGGLVAFNERMSLAQLLGFVALLAGVTVVAATA